MIYRISIKDEFEYSLDFIYDFIIQKLSPRRILNIHTRYYYTNIAGAAVEMHTPNHKFEYGVEDVRGSQYIFLNVLLDNFQKRISNNNIISSYMPISRQTADNMSQFMNLEYSSDVINTAYNILSHNLLYTSIPPEMEALPIISNSNFTKSICIRTQKIYYYNNEIGNVEIIKIKPRVQANKMKNNKIYIKVNDYRSFLTINFLQYILPNILPDDQFHITTFDDYNLLSEILFNGNTWLRTERDY